MKRTALLLFACFFLMNTTDTSALFANKRYDGIARVAGATILSAIWFAGTMYAAYYFFGTASNLGAEANILKEKASTIMAKDLEKLKSSCNLVDYEVYRRVMLGKSVGPMAFPSATNLSNRASYLEGSATNYYLLSLLMTLLGCTSTYSAYEKIPHICFDTDMGRPRPNVRSDINDNNAKK